MADDSGRRRQRGSRPTLCVVASGWRGRARLDHEGGASGPARYDTARPRGAGAAAEAVCYTPATVRAITTGTRKRTSTRIARVAGRGARTR
jgi:hypothetical protein